VTVLTIDEIDRELASRTDELAAMAATLMELDGHRGLVHVRRCSPEGVTAQRWTAVEASLAQLWQDLGRATTILDSAHALRARRRRPTGGDVSELTKLLYGLPLEASRRAIPLAQRGITDPAEAVEYVGLAGIVDRMRAAYPAVIEFCDAVDEMDAVIAELLTPIQRRLDEASAAGPEEIVELLRLSATDPLSLTVQAVTERTAAIAASVEQRAAELAEIAAIRADWNDALASTGSRLDELQEATRRAADVRVRAERAVVGGSLPMRPSAEPALRAELADISAGSISAPDPAALRSLRQRIGAALRVVDDDTRLAQGLLDRGDELRGRLTVYQAKAARIGLGEDPEILASGRIAAGLLSRRPCDLRAVTRTVNDFQQLIVEKQGKTS
jgi:hypothetical protein